MLSWWEGALFRDVFNYPEAAGCRDCQSFCSHTVRRDASSFLQEPQSDPTPVDRRQHEPLKAHRVLAKPELVRRNTATFVGLSRSQAPLKQKRFS